MSKKFMPIDDYLALKEAKGKVDFFSNYNREDAIKLADNAIVICSNWPTTSQGKPSDFMFFLDKCKALGIEVTAC